MTKLDQMYREGIDVLPAGMRGAPHFLSTSQSTIAGLGQNRRPARITGDPSRVARTVALTARQTAWGTGRSFRRPSAAERARNKQRFVQWIRKNQPRLYAIAKQRAGTPPPGLGQLTKDKAVDTTEQSWFERFTSTISNLAPSYLQYQSQKELLEIQLQRAQQGLPPLETSQYAPAVQVGLDPEQTRAAIAAAGERAGAFLTQPAVMLAAGGLVLFMVMRK